MSRWRNNAVLQVYIASDRLVFAVVDGKSAVVPGSISGITYSPESPAMLEAIEKMMTALSGSINRIDLVFGLPWVYYAGIPWRPAYREGAVLDEYARETINHRFSVAGDLAITCSPVSYARSVLVAALPMELLDGVKTCLKRSGVKHWQVVPAMMPIWRRYRSQLSGTGRLEIADQGRVLSVRYWEGSIEDVFVMPRRGNSTSLVMARPDSAEGSLLGMVLAEGIAPELDIAGREALTLLLGGAL